VAIPAIRQTAGLLQHVRIDRIEYIGKESNSLENVESGLMHSAQNAYTEYVDRLRAGHSRPHRRNQELLTSTLEELGER
jgi:hypothetical protein